MSLGVVQQINRIVARESKSASYKYALLRGAVETVAGFSHLLVPCGDRVRLPLGIMAYKWLGYYYPLMASPVFIPQVGGEATGQTSLAFRGDFAPVTGYYGANGGYPAFMRDLEKGAFPAGVRGHVFALGKKIRDTVVRQPMFYIGSSLVPEGQTRDGYFLFRPDKPLPKLPIKPPEGFGLAQMAEMFGSYTLPADYVAAFHDLGPWLVGESSLLPAWAGFSAGLSADGSVTTETVLAELMRGATTDRDMADARAVFEKMGDRCCVWRGTRVGDEMQVDHILPFSVWRNNDLWNLVPSSPQANRKKSDRIPTPELLESCRPRIIGTWEAVRGELPARFDSEVRVSLVGGHGTGGLLGAAFESLKEKSRYLIEVRGLEPYGALP